MPTYLQTLRAAARATSGAVCLAAAVSSALVATPALAAEPAAPVRTTVAFDSSRANARRTPDNTASSDARRHRDSATALLEAGDLRRARREFLTAARLMREAGMLPALEIQSVAAIDFARGRALDAGAAMDLLVADAIAFGNPDVQARALLDAIWLYTRAGRDDVARERTATLRLLLASPFVSAGTRREASARMSVDVATRPNADAR